MRSIRLSLLFYFVALLGLALGAVSLVVYRQTLQTLAEKEHNAEQRIRAEYDERVRIARADLDADLLYQAHALARLAQLEPDRRDIEAMQLHTRWWNEIRLSPRHRNRTLPGLSMVLTALNPFGIAHPNPMWLAEAHPSPFLAALPAQGQLTEIRLEENELPKLVSARLPDYFQINSSWETAYYSQSLRNLDLKFPFDLAGFVANPVYEYRFDDYDLDDELTVRRVTLKAPPGQLVFWSGRSRPPTSPRSGPPPRGGNPERAPAVPPLRPAIFIQCASELERLDGAIAEFEAKRDGELTDLRAATAASVTSLRNTLLMVNGATFGAAFLGIIALVHVGLLPLSRLSDAVSRVSEKDFRLHLEDDVLTAELRPIAGRLQTTLDQLRHAFDREKQAAADISHELRTPVAALLTTIDVTLRKPRTVEHYRETLSECRASGQQIGQLVERLLTLARLDAGVDRLRVEPVDVANVAEQCTALVRPLAEARGLTLQLHTKGPALLRADPAKLREVITNLLHNAIEYNRPDGRVDLTVVRENGTLRVEVSDTGVGIADEAKAHLFERFFRADPSRQAEGLHAGLGLAIVKGYVDLMGGSVVVDSALNRGSTFRVELPAA